MKLEQQVTSLEISTRLKELGVKQDGLFNWANYISQPPRNESSWTLHIAGSDDWANEQAREHISAFTVAELGEMLRPTTWTVVSRPIGNQWGAYTPTCEKWGEHYANTEADARGKMLIYILENNLLKS